ncbi:glycosyltransferase [Nonomuraea sp. B19D2]|uniref:glycosyltransferase n=1 Tax=Nonomuraea sp. B19D2 TaxID=3159561 RepID=UPI0032DB97BF
MCREVWSASEDVPSGQGTPIKVLVLTHGTRGDVQPYAALALALKRAGHEPVLGAPAAMAGLADPHGIAFAPLHDGPNTLIDDPDIRQAIETNYRGLRGTKIALQVMRRSKPLMAAVFDDMATVAEHGADLVVHAPGIPAQHLAERLGVPAVPAVLQPVWVPTAAFRNPMLPLPLPKALNQASYLPIKLMLRSFGGIADDPGGAGGGAGLGSGAVAQGHVGALGPEHGKGVGAGWGDPQRRSGGDGAAAGGAASADGGSGPVRDDRYGDPVAPARPVLSAGDVAGHGRLSGGQVAR